MAEVFFFIAAIGALAGAIGVVTLRNPFYSVLALVCHLLSLAALFLLLRAEFVAAAQVIVYAGAVMVLYVFVVAYVGGGDADRGCAGRSAALGERALFAVALFVELSIACSARAERDRRRGGRGLASGFGTPAQIGELSARDFLLPFEVARSCC